MDLSQIVVLVSIAAIYAIWYWFATREERRKAKARTELRLQRRMLGIEPGVGTVQPAQQFPKRCPRGVCTNPGASCPRECVEEPQVMRLIDGRVVHTYDNLEICFGPAGNVQEVTVGGRTWI